MLVIDTTSNPEKAEIYRKRRCKKCGHEIYTREQEAIVTFNFYEAWWKHHR